ncbi:MAG TPA: CoA-transferase [Syntrophales bacterium]|nr:CoA-transferase [Syntrophales bacterium]HPQ45144.1 CoA-transferase [Syntrophales bacterium]
MDVIEEGKGGLFTDPDPDKARAFFRKKSRKMENKLMMLKEAVEKFVHDGDYLAIGGFGANRTPIAACHEIVRQGRKNMAFAGHTSTHDFQILSAGKVFNRLDIAYIIGLEARGLSQCARKYMQSGEVEISEWTNYSLAARLKAAAMGVPFVPTRNMLGTDTLKHSGAKVVACPFTGKKMTLQPALYPDISVIHVHEADVFGNCRIRGIMISDDDLARASKHLIITTERLIPNEEIRRDPTNTVIPYYLVDAVCEVPFGAYPGTMPYEYFSDEVHLQEWLKAEKNPEDFKEFLNRNIYDCPDNFEYIERNGGLAKMNELRMKEFLLHKEADNGGL